MRGLSVTLCLVMLIGCTTKREVVEVINGKDGVNADNTNIYQNLSDINHRLELNEQLDSARSEMISLNSEAIRQLELRVSTLESLSSQLRQDLDTETSTRINNEIMINELIQAHYTYLMELFDITNNTINNLQNQVNQHSTDVTTLYNAVSMLNSQVYDLNTRIDNVTNFTSSLQAQLYALSMRLDREGVQVFKCSETPSEAFLKINGNYYRVQEYATLATITIYSSSTSQVISIPKMCSHDDKVKFPGGNGACPSSWTTVTGTGISWSIPAYSSSSATVVSSVTAQLEEFTPSCTVVAY